MSISTRRTLFLAGIVALTLGVYYIGNSYWPIYPTFGWRSRHFAPMTIPWVSLLGLLIPLVIGFALYKLLFSSPKAILKRDPNNLQALIALGNDCFNSHQYQQAQDAYSKALSVNPKKPDVRTNMGIIYRKLKQFDNAIAAFRQAAMDGPGHFDSRFHLGVVLRYDKKDFRGAIQAWEEFLDLKQFMYPDDERIEMVKKEIKSMKASLANK
jgi:tetratricopeptide (TPR) repeat protein